MQNETLYNRTVDILVQAYFNDTLVHGNYCGCAVGNLVAANMGIEITKDSLGRETFNGSLEEGEEWYNAITTYAVYASEKGIQQIKSTGYSFDEITLIERTFEGHNCFFGNEPRDEAMFNGLMAVIDVLDQIHGNTDATVTTSTKDRFVKQLV